MMAHAEGFVASIQTKDGKTVREFVENGERVVYLPHDTEYTIFLKNKHDRRAAAYITIDGMDALQGGLVIPAHGTTTLDRFMLDGDLTKGRALKFVALNSREGQNATPDPDSRDNGLIIVNFHFEREESKVITRDAILDSMRSGKFGAPGEIGGPPTIDWSMGDFSAAPVAEAEAACEESCAPSGATTAGESLKGEKMDGTVFSDDAMGLVGTFSKKRSTGQHVNRTRPTGATTQGDISRTGFRVSCMRVEDNRAAQIRIRLHAAKNVVTTRDKVFCPECGTKCATNQKHCHACGYNLMCFLTQVG